MAVQVNGSIRFSDSVFGENHRLHIAGFVKLHEIAHDLIDHIQISADGRMIRAEALKVVI